MQNARALSKTALTLVTFLLLASAVFAISADQAVAIVTTQNNYLLPNETASVSKGMITYKGEDYIVVAAQSDSKVNAYIPLKNSTGEVASQDLEIRELIKTAIVYTQMSQLSQNVATADWPFSYSTKSYFYDLSTDFGSLMNSIITVQTELGKINDPSAKQLATSANALQVMAYDLSQESTKTANQVETARVFEQNFFNNPDTNEVSKYEDYYNAYFDEISSIKDKFNSLDAKLTELSQGIGALETTQITIDQKRSFQALLVLPTNARRLPNLFSSTDQLRTSIEGVFNDATNSEGYATALASRKVRNDAWLAMYGNNDELLKLDKSFTTLDSAATAVLSTDNVSLWTNQDAVSALKSNWSGAQSRFNNAEYVKAKAFAVSAQTNIKQIIAGGVTQPVDNSSDLLTKALIGLVVAIVIIFVLEKFVLNKKKKPEEYNEPNYK